jgi:phospholipid/cholesterol/gamma-HCH transport system substrate-binding protein
MENRSHALAAGIFTLLLSLGIIAAAMWLNRDTQERTPYVLTTTGSVAGLNPQAAVRYRGMEVGKVEAIEFDREQPGRILVRIGILPTTPVTTATFAELGMHGLTGLAYVQLDTDPKVKSPALVPSTASAPARLAIRPSLFDRFSISGEDLIISAATAMNQVNKLLGDDNQKQLMQTLTNLQGVSTRLGQLADEVKPAAVAISGLATDGRKALAGVAPVLRSADETLASIGKLSIELSRRMDVVDRAGRGVEQAGQGVGEIARSVSAMETQSLPRLNLLLDEAGRGARTVERVADRLGDEPASVLFGTPPARPGPGEPGFTAPSGGVK